MEASCFNPTTAIKKIMDSGDGKLISPAYELTAIGQEYEVVGYLKLKPRMQKVYVKDGDFYETIVTDSKTVYFKFSTPKALNKSRSQII